MSDSGGSAELKAAALAAAGDLNARAWALGAEGERRVAEALKALPEGWVALHDRLLYPGVTDSNIDHIVVGPGGIFMLDHESFDILGRWEIDRGPQFLHYDFWWHLGHDTMITSEWGTPSMVRNGLDPEALLAGRYGHALHV